MNTQLFKKDFISTQDWTVDELWTMLEAALKLKADFAMGVPQDHILRAKTLYMLFFEESTRTRNSFETGMTQLGGHAIYLTPKATQIDHGENAKDTGLVLGSYGNAIAIRDCRTGIGQRYLRQMAEWSPVPIYSMQEDVDRSSTFQPSLQPVACCGAALITEETSSPGDVGIAAKVVN